MKSAATEKRLKKLVRAALNEVFEEKKGFIENPIVEAMEEAEGSETVSRDRIDRLLKRGR